MDSRDLTKEQAHKMLAAIEPSLHYINKLAGRMQQRNFDINDQLWRRTRRAQNAILALVAELRHVAKQAKR